MKRLIIDVSQMQPYVRFAKTLEIDNVAPYISQAEEQYLLDILGEPLMEELRLYVNASPFVLKATTEELLDKVRMPLSQFAFLQALPTLDLLLSSTGLMVGSSNNLVPASAARVDNLKKSLIANGYLGLEILLRFLEVKKTTYPEWLTGAGYADHFKFLLRDATDFDTYVFINKSRLLWCNMRSIMANVERLVLEPAVSKALVDKLKSLIKSGSFTGPYAVVLEPLKAALAHYTFAELTTSGNTILDHVDILKRDAEILKLSGKHYLGEALKILDAAPDDFPEYKNSEQYVATRTKYSSFDNTAANHIFKF